MAAPSLALGRSHDASGADEGHALHHRRSRGRRLLNHDGTALMIGMLLDQQVPMEVAFTGPATLLARLGHLDAGRIAAMAEDELRGRLLRASGDPPLPRGDGAAHPRLCAVLVARYGGRAEGVWAGVADGRRAVPASARACPGTGTRSRGSSSPCSASGWVCNPTAGARSPASSATPPRGASPTRRHPSTLAEVRTWKRAQKAANLDKQDRPLPSAMLPGDAITLPPPDGVFDTPYNGVSSDRGTQSPSDLVVDCALGSGAVRAQKRDWERPRPEYRDGDGRE